MSLAIHDSVGSQDCHNPGQVAYNLTIENMYTLSSFGAARLDEDGVQLSIQPITYLFLVYILLGPDELSREMLCRSFWPNATKSLAKHALSQQLYTLRKRLPKLRIHATPTHVRIDKHNVTLDALTILRNASSISPPELSAYAASFLEGVADRLTPELQHWRDELEAQLQHNLIDRLLSCADEAERTGDWLLAETLLTQAYVHGCRTSSICARLLDVYNALNKTSAAESIHEEACSLFGKSWGIDHPLRHELPAESSDHDEVGRYRFVGRAREFNWLRERWRAASAGHAQLVVIRGDAGVGKTRLAFQLEKLCTLQGGRVYRARCFEAGRRIAYAPVAQLLSLIGSQSQAPVVGAEVLACDPIASKTPPDPLLRAADMAQLLESSVTKQVSAAPVLLVIDDCQWLDQPTADLLAYLHAQLARTRLLILACTRVSAGAQGGDVLATIVQEEVSLSGLSEAETITLARSVCADGAPDDLASIASLSGGNPFFLLELLRQPRGKGRSNDVPSVELPTSIQRLVKAKYNQLNVTGQRVADAAAVLDSAARPSLLAVTGALTDDVLLRGVEELVREGFIEDSASATLRLKHDLIREAVYVLIDKPSRTLLHRRAARALMQINANAGEIADHAEKGGLPKLAWRSSVAAGDRAAAMHAGQEAIHWYSRAVRISRGRKSAAIAMDRVLGLAASGQAPQSSVLEYLPLLRSWHESRQNELGMLRCDYVEVYESLLTGEISVADRVARLLAVGSRAETLGDPALALEAFKEAVASASNSLPRRELAELLRSTVGGHSGSKLLSVPTMSYLAACMVVCGTSEEAVTWAESAVHEAMSSTVPQYQVQALAARATAYWAAGRVEEALHDFLLAVDQGDRIGHVSNLNGIRANFSLLLVDMARYTEAEDMLTAVAAHTRNRGHLILINLALLAFETGDYHRALPLLAECEGIARRTGASWLEMVVLALRGLIGLQESDRETAINCWNVIRPRVRSFLAATSDPTVVATFAARMMTYHGDLESACEMLEQVAADVELRNAVVAAKLRLEIADLQVDVRPDHSYRLARTALAFGETSGALSVRNKATELLEHIQLKRP